jgi:acyl-coenzyme A synthetase/AMP-(fatty) acid ligase
MRSAKRSHWVLCTRNPLEMLVGCLAVWSNAGSSADIGASVALPPNLLPATITRLAAHLDAGILLGAEFEAQSASLSGSRDGALTLELAALLQQATVTEVAASDWARAALEQLTRLRSNRAPCLTLFTSGTTGDERAWPKCLEQLLSEAELHAVSFFGHPALAQTAEAIVPPTRVLCCVPAHHIFGLLFGVLVPFSAAIPFIDVDAEHELIRRRDILGLATDLVAAPAQLGAWVQGELGTCTPRSTRRIFTSGAPLNPALARQLLERGAEVVELFGSTETGGIATRRDDPTGPWLPLPGLSVREDEEQRLRLRSPFLGAPDVEVTTADRICMVANGFVHLGRADDVVKVGAKRIALGEVESFVRALPGVGDAALLVAANEGLRDSELWLAVVPASAVALPPTQFEQQIRAALRENFDGVLVPRRIRVAARLPRTDTGKLPRAALLELFSMAPSAGSVVPPAGQGAHHETP